MKKKIAIVLLAVASLSVVACGGPKYITNLPLEWRGVGTMPKATADVEQAFGAGPLDVQDIQDNRSDKSVVGVYEEEQFQVRTTTDVAVHLTKRYRQMFESAGATLGDSSASVHVTSELLEYQVNEAGLFNGRARMKVTVTRAGAQPWMKVYEGASKRWGRTHNAANYNEALSNAFVEIAKKILKDPAFGAAVAGKTPASGTPDSAPSSTPSSTPADTTIHTM